jgi:hypothetical protein
MIEVISYKSVNGLEFGASPKRVIEVFGEPNDKGFTNNNCIECLNYDNYSIIFDGEKFSEFVICPHVKAIVNGVKIGWTLKELLEIIKLDKNPRIDNDGITLYNLGMYIYAFDSSDDDDFNDKAIEFFKKGIMDEHKKNTKPFNLEELKKEIKDSNLEIDLP